MNLSTEQYSTIKSLLFQYWYGTRESEQFTITDGVTLTVDHTEKDEVRFTVSFQDITVYCESKPNTLSEIDEFSSLVDQIQTLIQSQFGEQSHTIELYKEPSVHIPMAQYTVKTSLKTVAEDIDN